MKQFRSLLKEYWKNGHSVITNCGFTIAVMLKTLNVSLKTSAFFKGQDQLQQKEVAESQIIAVEKQCTKLKNFNKKWIIS